MNPYAILGGVLLLIAAAGGGYYEGWSHRGDREAAIQLELVNEKNVQIEVERVRADGLAAELEVEKLNIKTVTIEKIKEVPSVTTIYKESPDAPVQVIPDPVYTLGFMRVWNGAYGTMLMPTSPSRPVGAPGEADIVRAKIDSADILFNHVENAGKHAACYAQLNKLIDLELGRGQPAPPAGP